MSSAGPAISLDKPSTGENDGCIDGDRDLHVMGDIKAAMTATVRSRDDEVVDSSESGPEDDLYSTGSEDGFGLRRRALPIDEEEIYSSSEESGNGSEESEDANSKKSQKPAAAADSGPSVAKTKKKSDDRCSHSLALKHEFCQKSTFSVDDNPFEYLRNVRAEAARLAAVPRQAKAVDRRSTVTDSTGKVSPSSRPGCKYVRHLLHRAGKSELEVNSRLFPEPGQANSSVARNHCEDFWSDRVVEYFEKFREHLSAAVEALPNLSGECSRTGYQAPERDWTREHWERLVTTQRVTVDVIGVMDSVRSSIVLSAVAKALCNLNSGLASAASAAVLVDSTACSSNGEEAMSPVGEATYCFGGTSMKKTATVADQIERGTPKVQTSVAIGQRSQTPAVQAGPGACATAAQTTVVAAALAASPLKLTTPLQWCFAALASLDNVQALDADVAANLQVIRRCCRWLRSNLSEGPGTCQVDMQTSLQVVEILIVDYFNQK